MRVGVIGCGFQGRLHLEILSRLPDVEVVAVADIDPLSAGQSAQEYDAPNSYTDYREMLDSERLDLVTICTMPVHHAEMTVAAFDRGAHVLCEKPLAMSTAEGIAMVNAARSADRILAVGFNMRFMPNSLAIESFIRDGGFGRPVYTRVTANDVIPWWGEHYRREISGGGALAASAVHLLDLALYFAGFPEPISASASMATLFPKIRGSTAPDSIAAGLYNAEDLFSAHVRFENGFWLTIEGSWIGNQSSGEGQQPWEYELIAIGEKAQVWFDPLAIRGEAEDGTIVDLLPPDSMSDLSFPLSVERSIVDVVSAVREGRDPCASGEQALVVQRIVDAIYSSASSGSEQPILRLGGPLGSEDDG
jgi:predicted dehydrogenase